ncbi:MAG: signal peptidase I [Candidatus Woesearchaeota archaeon]|jgi:signal peptidase|nr:signal peptidase I [Candidatus Woesearchaeota archaeon]
MKINYKYLTIIEIQIILIFFLSIFTILNSATPIFIIQSDSMLPSIEVGDIVIIKNYEFEDLNLYLNKTIAFYNPIDNRIIVHRVIKINENNIYTKGDNTLFIDEYTLRKENILGIIISII